MSISEAIPRELRRRVIERDDHRCRICGQWVAVPGLHHIVYRSGGGLNVAENLVVVGWQPGHDCHLTIAHGPQARTFRPLLQQCTADPSVTAVQLLRWANHPGAAPQG